MQQLIVWLKRQDVGNCATVKKCEKKHFRIILPQKLAENIALSGDPDKIRTCGLQIRNLSLYPTELRGRYILIPEANCYVKT